MQANSMKESTLTHIRANPTPPLKPYHHPPKTPAEQKKPAQQTSQSKFCPHIFTNPPPLTADLSPIQPTEWVRRAPAVREKRRSQPLCGVGLDWRTD